MTAENFEELMDFLQETEPEETFVRLKEHKYEIVSLTAFLIGVSRNNFAPDHNFNPEVYEKLSLNKNARIIRNLCRVRNEIERNFKALSDGVRMQNRNVLNMIPGDAVTALSNDGIKFCQKPGTRPVDYIIETNRLIQDRINNCRSIFPAWLNWEYVKELFIMPGGLTEQGAAAAASVFYQNMRYYPYRKYINWIPAEEGNILRNDKAFVNYIYEWHEDEFPMSEQNKLMDASSYVKSNIYEFLDRAKTEVDMVVDCENSDVYNIISMFSSLNEENYLGKISKIILVNDPNQNIGWQKLENCVKVPVEHIMTERIKEDKSLVDGTLIVKGCEEFYERGVKSFILLSSDSDFWAIMKLLKSRVDFLVMVEHLKCGPDLKRKLEEEMIFYCYLDDFCSAGQADEMKTAMLRQTIENSLAEKNFNAWALFEDALLNLRIELTAAQKKEFFDRYLKKMQLAMDSEGRVSISLR